MKKITSIILLWLFSLGAASAFNVEEIPDEFYVTQHWISYTTSFDVKTKEKIMGTLYRRVFSLLLKYDFYDPYDTKLATAKARFFSIGAHFDIYDQQERLLGMVKEQFFTFFPSFDLYSSDSRKLLEADMNFWGTQFTVYDTVTRAEVATMKRPFFRLKNDWIVEIKNRELLRSRNINASLFMTVIAFQGDMEDWSQLQDTNFTKKSAVNNLVAAKLGKIQERMALLSKEQHLEKIAIPNESTLEEVAKKLDEDFQHSLNNQAGHNSTVKQLDDFVGFCFELVQSETIDVSEKKAILYLLQKRIESTQNN